jgi:hydrogenase-4 component F
MVGGVFGLGLIALLGLPPFSLFASELAIVRSGAAAGLGWAVAAAMVLLLVIFAAVIGHAQHMLLGEPVANVEAHHTPSVAAVPMVTGLAVVAALGVSIWPIERLLHAAARVVTG